jgi:hypothetical protein
MGIILGFSGLSSSRLLAQGNFYYPIGFTGQAAACRGGHYYSKEWKN